MVFQWCFIGDSNGRITTVWAVLVSGGDAMEFSKAAAELVGAYERSSGGDLATFARTSGYRQFVGAAERAGFTGPDIEMDSDFSGRSPDWVAQAEDAALQRWVHTLIRADRCNGDYPDAVWKACRSGSMGELVARLNGTAGALHAGR